MYGLHVIVDDDFEMLDLLIFHIARSQSGQITWFISADLVVYALSMENVAVKHDFLTQCLVVQTSGMIEANCAPKSLSLDSFSLTTIFLRKWQRNHDLNKMCNQNKIVTTHRDSGMASIQSSKTQMNRPLIGCSSLDIRNRCLPHLSNICQLHIHLVAGTCMLDKQTRRIANALMQMNTVQWKLVNVCQQHEIPRCAILQCFSTRVCTMQPAGTTKNWLLFSIIAIKRNDQQKFESNLSILFMHQWTFNKLLSSGSMGHATISMPFQYMLSAMRIVFSSNDVPIIVRWNLIACYSRPAAQVFNVQLFAQITIENSIFGNSPLRWNLNVWPAHTQFR